MGKKKKLIEELIKSNLDSVKLTTKGILLKKSILNYFGEKDTLDEIICFFWKSEIKNLKLPVDVWFLGDLVWWLLQLLLDGKSGDAYNVGSDQPISISELAQKVALLSMRSPKILIQGQANYSVGVPVRTSYIPSIEKAKFELGLHISTDLSSTIAQTLNSMRRFN